MKKLKEAIEGSRSLEKALAVLEMSDILEELLKEREERRK